MDDEGLKDRKILALHVARNGLIAMLSKSTTKWWEIAYRKISKGENKKLIKGKMQMDNNYIQGSSMSLLIVLDKEEQMKIQDIVLQPLDL